MSVIPLPPRHDDGLCVAVRDGATVVHQLTDPSAATALDLLVETACELLEVDYAGVHVVDDDVHTVLSGSDVVPMRPLPRFDSLCGVLLTRHVVGRAGPAARHQVIEVRDTADDPTLPVVTHGGTDEAPVRFYAAAPVVTADGRVLGTLCVIAHHPRTLTPLERRTLLLLGAAASTLLAGCAPTPGG